MVVSGKYAKLDDELNNKEYDNQYLRDFENIERYKSEILMLPTTLVPVNKLPLISAPISLNEGPIMYANVLIDTGSTAHFRHNIN